MNADLILGIPDWARTARFDITAQAPRDSPANARIGPMIRSLLEDRLNLKWHTKERPISGYVLVAAKPKMKKADPASRTHCIFSLAPAGSPPGSLAMTCQNITMTQFADQITAPGCRDLAGRFWIPPALRADGILSWDFMCVRSRQVRVGRWRRGRGSRRLRIGSWWRADYFEALEKQLGLKLESQKRPMTVTVIDHLEQEVGGELVGLIVAIRRGIEVG